MFEVRETPSMQRSRGQAFVRLGSLGIADLLQSGSAKVMLPKISQGSPEVVFLNTSGGLASGDQLEFGVDLQENTRAIATSQTAERVYRAKGPPARAQVRLQVGEGGWLDWLPQETILFNGSRLDRVTEIKLASNAGCMMLDIIILGRLAMGEKITQLHLTDRRIVRQAGRIIHHDILALNNAALKRLDGQAMLNGARAMATLAVIAPKAPDLLDRARNVLNEPGVISAASAPPGRLILRLLATDGWPLRRQLTRLLSVLRPYPLPRIWQV